jgi:hypothetical protein
MKKLKSLLIASATVGLLFSGCQMNTDPSAEVGTITESAVYASLRTTSSISYLLTAPVGSTIPDTQYEVTFHEGITMSNSFRNFLYEASFSNDDITDVSSYFSVSIPGVTGYSVKMTNTDIDRSDIVNGQMFYFHLYSADDDLISASAFTSGYIRVTLTDAALENNNGKDITTGYSMQATYAVGQYAYVEQNSIAYTHNNTYFKNTVVVVFNDSLNVTDWHSENGYPKSDRVSSWLTLPNVTDAKIMSEEVSQTNIPNDTITYVISGSTSNTQVDTSEIKLSIPSEYLEYYSQYSKTATVPLLSSLTSSVKKIPAAAKWNFINPSVDWYTSDVVVIQGTTTYADTASIRVTGDTFKASTATGTITPVLTFYDVKGNETSDIISVSSKWTAAADATTGTLSYQIKAAENSSFSEPYYASVTFDKSTLSNNEITPVTVCKNKLIILKNEESINIGSNIAIAEKSNTEIATTTELGSFTITLPKALDSELTAQKIYGNNDSTSDYFTLAYYGTESAGTDLANGTGLAITGKITTSGTTATVTLYALGTTKTNAESAKLVSGVSAKLYMTLTAAGSTAFNLDSGITNEFLIGTIKLSD